MIRVKYIEEDAAIVQVGKNLTFYFRVKSRKPGLTMRSIETLALVQALAEAVKNGMFTAWS